VSPEAPPLHGTGDSSGAIFGTTWGGGWGRSRIGVTSAELQSTLHSAIGAWRGSHARDFLADWFNPLSTAEEVFPAMPEFETGSTGSWCHGSEASIDRCELAVASRRRSSVAQRCPIFVLLQSALVVTLFVLGGFGVLGDVTGLEDHTLSGKTRLLVQKDCVDHRSEVWRWLTYQLMHSSVWHLVMNCIVLFLAGIPAERLHGSARLALMFNVGVVGGACCYFVSDPHIQVVGMSGGCYALMGIVLAHILMNWYDMRCPAEKLAFLLLLGAADILNAQLTWNTTSSHSTHFGGYVSGFCIGLLAGRRLRVPCGAAPTVLRATALFVAAALVVFSISWLATSWPPKEIWEDVGWCWARQVKNETLFGQGGYQCVRCRDLACIAGWQQQEAILEVSIRGCEERGWASTG